MKRTSLSMIFTMVFTGVLILALSALAAPDGNGRRSRHEVHARFDLSSPTASPYPSDRFTVADPDQNTGRRIHLPMPTDCIARASDCEDITHLNQLDGFNTHSRLSI